MKYKENDFLKRIEINPEIMVGKPVIKGTRIPVELILKLLGQGISFQEILEDYPRLKNEDVLAALNYASHVLAHEEVFPVVAE